MADSGRRRLRPDPDLPVGPEARALLVREADEWLTGLFDEAGGAQCGAALVAVGGLGRHELTPGSDLDLLLLHPPGSDVSGLADAIWYPIWDSGVALDHSVRTVSEARRLAASDLRVVLGILDARTIAGDDTLTAALRSSVLGDWRSMARQRLPELRESVELRREHFGDLAHMLEPNLKDGYGGLRDIVVLRAVAASWITDIPHGTLAGPHGALLDVRDALHRVAGRASDRLSAQEREGVGSLLGLGDGDAVLRAVYSAGRTVAYASDLTWTRLDRLARSRGVVRRLTGRRGPGRTPLADGVVAQDGEAVLALDARPESDPVLLLRAAAAAAQAGLALAPHAVERLAADSPPMPEPWPLEARDALVSLLGAGRATLPVWEALDQAGVWGRLIPEWEVLRSAPQHNPIHVFTVDRHLVETAIRASALTRRVRRPDLLLVGSLLHDVGKAREGDHTEVGVALVEKLAPRLGFDEADSGVLVDMVRHHLLLPEVATRRDIEDPSTAEQVARLVGDAETLDLLAALTEADSLATGPGVWSEWKARLVALLVDAVKGHLGAPAAAETNPLTPAQLALIGTDGLSVVMEPQGQATVVTVASPDSVGLLAATAGVLALHRLGVRSARTQTVGDRVLAVWTVVPEFGEVPPPERLRDDLRRALEGSLDVSAALARRERDQRPMPVPPPRVTVVPDASEVATVLEVRAHDTPGLLHRVASAISWSGVDISAALVATLGSEVVDAFYLRSAAGGPLDERELAAVQAAVLATLEDHRSG